MQDLKNKLFNIIKSKNNIQNIFNQIVKIQKLNYDNMNSTQIESLIKLININIIKIFEYEINL